MISVKKDRFYILAVVALALGSTFLVAHFVGGAPWSLDAPVQTFKMYGNAMPKILIAGYAGCFLFMLLAVALNPFREQNSLYGDSHFATEKEIQAMELRGNSGLVLGKKGGRYLRVSDPRSALVFAPPGTGKTAAVVIPSLLASDYSTVTYDPKGELLEKTGPWRSQFSTIQKFAPGEDDSLSWNPLAAEELPPAWVDIEVHVARIAECLLPVPDKGDAHWMTEARRIFMFWSLYLIHQNGATSFKEVLANALTDDPQGDVGACLLDEDLPERIILEGNAIVAKADKEFSGVLSSFSNALNVFLDPRVAKNTTKADIRLSQLRHERTSIYLVVSNQDSKRLKPILTLFFEMTANSALSKEPGPDELGILLMLDEFVRLGRMDEVKRTPAIGRSYRLVCVFVVQTLAQLASIYGQDGAEEFMGTCSYQVFFTQNEPRVAQMLSQAIGNKTIETKSKSGRFMETKSTSLGHTGVPLLRGEEILSLPFGEVLILRQSHYNTPVKAKGAFWFRERELKRCIAFQPQTSIEDEPELEIADTAPGQDAEIPDLVMAPIPEGEDSEPVSSVEDLPEPEAEGEVDPFETESEEDPFEPADEWSDADLDSSPGMM